MDLTMFLAQAATKTAEVVPEQTASAGEGGWKVVLWALVGAAVLRGVQWLADFLTKGGQKKLLDLLGDALKKSNDTSVGAQLQVDDFIARNLGDVIPVVFGTLTDTLKKDMEDGKLDADQWRRIHMKTWNRIEPMVKEGANNYLTTASVKDGTTLAKMAWDKWAAKKQEDKEKPSEDK